MSNSNVFLEKWSLFHYHSWALFSKGLFFFFFFFLWPHSLADETNDLYLVRPKANTVFSHPFFEDLKEKIQLVSDLCEGQRDDIDFLNELESNAPILKNPDWLSRFFAYTSIYVHSNEQPFEDFKVWAVYSLDHY